MRNRALLRTRRGKFVALGTVVIVLIAAGVAAYLVVASRTADVDRGTEVPFSKKGKGVGKEKEAAFSWPFYGLDVEHTRDLKADIRPPFEQMWRLGGSSLLEFSPILVKGTLFLARNDGLVEAIDSRNGSVLWKRRFGRLNASSPAYHAGRIIVVSLSKEVAALDAKTGRTEWRKMMPSRIESSPIASRGIAYFGSEDGTLYAMRVSNGEVKWRWQAHGAIKASPALHRGVLYVGDYAGSISAVRAKTGALVWSVEQTGGTLGLSAGRYYATPTVAYGRVYLGNIDGKVYSLSARTGSVAWSRTTGDYVYSAAAVADRKGMPPVVLLGSYDGYFYAFDARTGDTVWKHHDGGRISGAPTVVGDVVYYASLGQKKTFGLDLRTGEVVFRWKQGGFNPVISDGEHIFLTGWNVLWGLKPKDRKQR